MRLLLDLGGVVIKTPFEMLHLLGNPPWTGPFDPSKDDLWRAMQQNEISERDYWERRAREYFDGVDPMRQLFKALLDQPEDEVVRPELVELLADVERPAALTNDMSRFHSQQWIDRMSVLSRFVPLIDLSAHEVLKPEPAAFELALRLLQQEASEVLFVDDQQKNLDGAAQVGMNICWFDVTNVAGSIAQIKERLAIG